MFSGVALRKTLVGFVCLGTRTLTRRPYLDKWEQAVANSCSAVVRTALGALLENLSSILRKFEYRILRITIKCGG